MVNLLWSQKNLKRFSPTAEAQAEEERAQNVSQT